MQFSPHTGLLWQFIWPLKNRGDFWRSFFFGGKQMFLKILLWLWQLPQNLIGFIYSRVAKSKSTFYFNNKKTVVYYCSCFKSGICLGQYIILDVLYKRLSSGKTLLTVQHEYGHSMQSKYLGCFYLLIIGLPSICRNIYSRIFKKNSDWYYSSFPENWADKLGGIKR